jgi:tRNA threonylcarbamoyladenosine biosynthesis protein TsaB
VRILAVETSSVRGTVALVDGTEVVAVHAHATPNAHGEHLIRLTDAARADAGWARSSIDRLAVGVGPGSFTGLRVGIAFAQGLSMGLGRPLFGVGSLRAMAEGAPSAGAPLRCPVLDARRDEVFIAAYDAQGEELYPPSALAPAVARAELGLLGRPLVLLGEGAALLEGLAPALRSPESDLPHAVMTARIAARLREGTESADPLYLRPVDAIRPRLPPSPLSSPEG